MPRLLLTLLLLASTSAHAEPAAPPPSGASAPTPAAAPEATAPPDMESFQLVLLVRGPAWTPEPTAEVMEIQKAHVAHLTKLANEGRIVVAGPFADQDDVTKRGLCVYRVGSIDEARRLASEDPAVKAGRLKVEVMSWWVEKGYMEFPKAPPIAD
jgi:uncharacterized protein YciI